jgi:hypothetical protein
MASQQILGRKKREAKSCYEDEKVTAGYRFAIQEYQNSDRDYGHCS